MVVDGHRWLLMAVGSCRRSWAVSAVGSGAEPEGVIVGDGGG